VFDKFCSKKGYAMVKLFGFMLAVVAMISSANAALLVSYEFGANEEKDPTFEATGVVAETSSGALSYNPTFDRLHTGGISSSGVSRQERFAFTTTGPNFLKLSTMTFDTALAVGTRPATVTPTFKLNGATVASNLYTVLPASGFGTYTVSFNPSFKIDGGVSFEAAITFLSQAGSGEARYALDNVKFDGQVCPEPASMAVFGLLGAGVAFRRLRRKA
jgi:hypothetical protein